MGVHPQPRRPFLMKLNQMQKVQRISTHTQDVRAPPPVIQPLDLKRLGAFHGGHNLDSSARWAAMVLLYNQAWLLFISSPLNASEPCIDFLIRMCYLPLHSKMKKTEVRAAATWSPCQCGTTLSFLDIFPLRVPGLITSADTALWLHPPKIP